MWLTAIGWADAGLTQCRGPARWTLSIGPPWTDQRGKSPFNLGRPRRSDGPGCPRAASGGGSPEEGQMGLPCTIFDGERMERKRRRWGNSPAAWKEGREAGTGDRRGGSGVGARPDGH
jgi:hypothetical protein